MVHMQRDSLFRRATRVPGKAWSQITLTLLTARPTNIRIGKWSTRKSGYLTTMSAYESTRAGPVDRPDTSIISLPGRRLIFINAKCRITGSPRGLTYAIVHTVGR